MKIMVTLTDNFGAKFHVLYDGDDEYYYWRSDDTGDDVENGGPFDTFIEARRALETHIYGAPR